MIPVIMKTLRDKRWVMLAWVLGMISLTTLTVLFFPSFSSGDTLAKLAESLPPQLQSFLGDINASKHLGGYIGTQLFSLRLPMFMIIFAVVTAISISATEEENRTLKTLQSWGIARWQVVAAKFVALAIMTLIVTFAVLPGIYIGAAILGDSVDLPLAFTATGMLWLLTYGIAAFSLLAAFAIGKKSVVVAVASSFAFYNVFLSMLAPAIKELHELYKLTLFYYFTAADPLLQTPTAWHVWLLLVFPIVCGGVAIVLYRRRDIYSQ